MLTEINHSLLDANLNASTNSELSLSPLLTALEVPYWSPTGVDAMPNCCQSLIQILIPSESLPA